MNIKQRFLKMLYPLLKLVGQLKALPTAIKENDQRTGPAVPFYSLSVQNTNGTLLDFKSLQGKKVLIVNVASQCGYTSQYAELEEVYQLNKTNLEIIGFPSNDFKGQEPGSDEEIASFCKLNFGVSFPLAKKGAVTGNAQPVFEWLTNKRLNGWNNELPGWNFYKYLIDEQGVLVQVLPSHISPMEIELNGRTQH